MQQALHRTSSTSASSSSSSSTKGPLTSRLSECVARASRIDGKGLFSVAPLGANLPMGAVMQRRPFVRDFIPPPVWLELPFEMKFAHTESGRWINHDAVAPTLELGVGGAQDLRTARFVTATTLVDLEVGDELTCDYRVLEKLAGGQRFLLPLLWFE